MKNRGRIDEESKRRIEEESELINFRSHISKEIRAADTINHVFALN